MNNPRALANLRPEFETGNGVAISHGAYARLRLSEAAGDSCCSSVPHTIDAGPRVFTSSMTGVTTLEPSRTKRVPVEGVFPEASPCPTHERPGPPRDRE